MNKVTTTGNRGAVLAKDVYVHSTEYAWIPATVIEQDATVAKVAFREYVTDEFIFTSLGGKGATTHKQGVVYLQNCQGRALPLQNCDGNGQLQDVPDLVDLPNLHEVRRRRESLS